MEKRKTYDRRGEEIIVKDSIGVQVYPGDTIVYIEPRYSNLKLGTVKKVNPKSITTNTNTVRYSYQFIKVVKYEEDGKV